MKYLFWFKKGSSVGEKEFDCSNMIDAYNKAHEFLRGYYDSSEADGDAYKFFNSKKELTGSLYVVNMTQEKNNRKGLATLGEMAKFKK